MKRFERIDGIELVRIDIPLEEAEFDAVRVKIRNGESVLLERRDLLLQIDMSRYCRADSSPARRPTCWARSNWPRQYRSDGVRREVLGSAP